MDPPRTEDPAEVNPGPPGGHIHVCQSLAVSPSSVSRAWRRSLGSSDTKQPGQALRWWPEGLRSSSGSQMELWSSWCTRARPHVVRRWRTSTDLGWELWTPVKALDCSGLALVSCAQHRWFAPGSLQEAALDSACLLRASGAVDWEMWTGSCGLEAGSCGLGDVDWELWTRRCGLRDVD